jgi:hypothetical protein
MTRLADILHEDKYTLTNVLDKIWGETRNTHFMFNFFFRKLCLIEIIWKKYCTAGQATVRQYGA